MEDVKVNDFVLMVRTLWGEQKKRELLYLEALKKDSMGPFRKVLSQGHLSAVLFQRELHSIYDYFKCFLTDKELGVADMNMRPASLLKDLNDTEEVAGLFKKIEAGILQLYKTLRAHVDRESEARQVLDEHLLRISEFYDTFSKLEMVNRKKTTYVAAA